MNREDALGEFRQDHVTLPPFSPKRVICQSYFYRQGAAYVEADSPVLLHKRERQRSEENLNRRVGDISVSGTFVWYSSNTLGMQERAQWYTRSKMPRSKRGLLLSETRAAGSCTSRKESIGNACSVWTRTGKQDKCHVTAARDDKACMLATDNHEEGAIRAFVQRDKQERFLGFLANPKKGVNCETGLPFCTRLPTVCLIAKKNLGPTWVQRLPN